MAKNPDERLGPSVVIEDLKNLPPGVAIPSGVDKTSRDWYAQTYTTQDGRVFFEFYKRGYKPKLEDGTYPPDPVVATVEGRINQEQADRFKKEQAEEQKPDPVTNVNGVPSTVVGKDANGRDIYAPVQTANGPATANTTSQGPSGGKPFIDDGPEAGQTGRRWGWNPETHLYDRDLGPSPSAQKPQETPKEEVNPSDPTRLRKPDGRGGWVDAGPNAAGVQAAADRAAKDAPKPEKAPDGSYGYWDIKPGQPPKWVPIAGNAPGAAPLAPVEVNGQWGVWKPGANGGPPTFETVEVPAPGAASAGGPNTPKMPNFILDASIKGLTDFVTAIHADPSLTPAQKDKRIQEAIQLANVAVAQWGQEETKRATQQREQESQRNTDYNVGVSSAKFLQDGQQAAFKFASELKGTDLGGKVFAAMLGLNLATLEAQNLTRLTSTGKPAPPLPTITPSDMRSTAAIDAKRAEIDQHITPRLATPPFVQPGTVPPEEQARAAANESGVPSDAQVRPIQPTSRPAVGPQVAPGGTPPALGQGQDLSTPPPPAASTAGLPLGQGQDASTMPPGSVPPSYPDMGVQQTTPPDFGAPGMRVTPPPVQPYDPANLPAQPTPTPPDPTQVPQHEVTMTPSPEFAALAQFQAPVPPPMVGQPAPGGAPDEMVAMRMAQIASQPAWRLSEDDLRFAQQHGAEDTFWKTPGMVA